MLASVSASAAGSQGARVFTGQVVRIVDGDTIRVLVGGREETVRYIGVNAPELGRSTRGEEPGARAAAEANRKLVAGHTVRLELDVQERDRDGRLLAYVYVGDTMINAELVAEGYAHVMTVRPNVKHQDLFLKLQREASLLRLGLWTESVAPTPPPSAAELQHRTEAGSRASPASDGRPGVPPASDGACPATQPIKGNFTTYSGERCIYHVPGGRFYLSTRAERCYASGADAVRDGCRASKR